MKSEELKKPALDASKEENQAIMAQMEKEAKKGSFTAIFP